MAVKPISYKELVYDHYRSSFKGQADDIKLIFGAKKIRPLLEPWTCKLNRKLPAVDLGCGAGELLIALQDLGFKDLAGCDLSKEQVDVAGKKFPKVIESDLFDYLIQHTDNSLELVTIFDVVEHLTRQETFDLFALIYQKLRLGGCLIVHLPNGLSPFVGHVFWGDITHEWCLTPKSAKTLCALFGFVEFEAKEHLGCGQSLKGKSRRFAWSVMRKVLQMMNMVETGSLGGSIWTRNFAFKVNKPFI